MGRAARRGKATHSLIEQYIKGLTPSERGVLPLGLFRLIKPYVDQIDNIHCLETIMYSKKLTIAGQVDCIAEYNGKLSVIDFKTANKERQEAWIENYFMQTTAYAQMYEGDVRKRDRTNCYFTSLRRWFSSIIYKRKERLYGTFEEID